MPKIQQNKAEKTSGKTAESPTQRKSLGKAQVPISAKAIYEEMLRAGSPTPESAPYRDWARKNRDQLHKVVKTLVDDKAQRIKFIENPEKYMENNGLPLPKGVKMHEFQIDMSTPGQPLHAHIEVCAGYCYGPGVSVGWSSWSDFVSDVSCLDELP